jgi:hypothetical protein
MISPQDKILYVAQKLGLRTLKNMQASTRAIYDQNVTAAGTFTLFEQANTRTFPNTNVNNNQFEVNEALLVEAIDFFIPTSATGVSYNALNPTVAVKFSLIIANKIVIKDAICEVNVTSFVGAQPKSMFYFEGVGILIPPQLEYKIEASLYDSQTRLATTSRLGCIMHGTAVLTNLNTSI